MFAKQSNGTLHKKSFGNIWMILIITQHFCQLGTYKVQQNEEQIMLIRCDLSFMYFITHVQLYVMIENVFSCHTMFIRQITLNQHSQSCFQKYFSHSFSIKRFLKKNVQRPSSLEMVKFHTHKTSYKTPDLQSFIVYYVSY